MNSTKFVLGGLVAGVAYFLLGYLIYGMLLSSFMDEHATAGMKAIMRPEGMLYWSMALGNLVFGFLMAYVLLKARVASTMDALVMGAVIGFFTSAAYNFIMYAQMNFTDLTAIGADIAAFTLISALSGALTGFVFSKMGKTASA